MKKISLIVLAAVILAACAAPPTNREASSTANANKAAETKASAPLTEAEATAKEKELWQTLTKKDLNAFGASLADDQLYVTSDGSHDKASTIKSVTGFVPTDVVFSDWKFLSLKDAVIVIYKTTLKGTMNGEAFPEGSAYASTVWANRGGKWLAIFHQDCEISKQPPPPPAKAAPKAAASPAATSSPATTSSDVVANEKAVWAALSAKHFDVFDTLLSPDFLEVEPVGVMDRAAAISGVQQFDFSKSTLSDWHTVKINDDAAIVTYTAHFPGQKVDTEYHSTVWVNRNGKWVGLFHHGSPKTPPPPAQTAKPTK